MLALQSAQEYEYTIAFWRVRPLVVFSSVTSSEVVDRGFSQSYLVMSRYIFSIQHLCSASVLQPLPSEGLFNNAGMALPVILAQPFPVTPTASMEIPPHPITIHSNASAVPKNAAAFLDAQ